MNITPKYGAEIEADIDVERTDGLGVVGSVKPALAGQKITITVQPVGGARFCVETLTDVRGRFRIFIDPRRTVSGKPPWEGQDARRLEGIYEVYCETFDARDLAYACSARLYYDFRRGVQPAPTRRVAAVTTEGAVARPRVSRGLVESVLQQTLPQETPVAASSGSAGEPAESDDGYTRTHRYRRPAPKR
jgi:hypothetical protein